jgi:hypothetical protein
VHPGSNTTGRNKNNTYRNIYVWNNGLVGFSDRGTDEGDNVNENCHNLFDNIQAWNNLYGIWIGAQNGGVLSNSFASGNGGDGEGMHFYRIGDFNIHDCYVDLSGKKGIEISGLSTNVNLTNVIVKNNNTVGIEEIYLVIAGIGIEDSSEIILANCQSYDDRGTTMQAYGVGLSGTNTGISLLNCKLTPNKSGDIYNPNGAVVTTVITEKMLAKF